MTPFIPDIFGFQGSYSSSSEDTYSYIRAMRKFKVPYPNPDGSLPSVVVTEIVASKDSTKAHDADAMAVQLARRDLNVVPSLLPCKLLIKSSLASDFFCQMLQCVT